MDSLLQITEDEDGNRAVISLQAMSAFEDIFIIDHALSVSHEDFISNKILRRSFKQNENLTNRIATMMGIDKSEHGEDEVVELLISRIWRYAGVIYCCYD